MKRMKTWRAWCKVNALGVVQSFWWVRTHCHASTSDRIARVEVREVVKRRRKKL